MRPYEVPEANSTSCKAISAAANGLLLRHGRAALQGRGAFDVMKYLEFHLVKEHETDYSVSSRLPEGTYAETRLKMMTLSESTYLDAMAGVPFARFTVAHEIGHVAMHQYLLMKRFRSSQHGGSEIELFTRGQLVAYRDPEWQANEFAAALLMPASGMTVLRQQYRERATYVSKVMETFNVSYTATNYRIDKLIKKGTLSF